LANPVESGKVIAQRFRGAMLEYFEHFFEELGSGQSQTAGDGFVCGCASRFFCDSIDIFLLQFINAWDGLISGIEKINGNLPMGVSLVGSRTVVMAGDYLYGRVGSITVGIPGFDGDLIIQCARAEQLTSAFAKERGFTHKHIVTVPESIGEEIVGVLAGRYDALSTISGKAKEAELALLAFAHRT
jgi:hypothetical protein